MNRSSISDGQETGRRREVVYRTSIEESAAASVSLAVVEAIGEITGKSVTEIGPIQDVLHTEALDALFSVNGGKRGSDQFPGFVSFEFEEFLITVHGTGEIIIRSRSEESY